MALAKGLTDMKIIMKQEKRPCTVWVNAETTINGLWHLFGWGKALIELEDGTMRWFPAEDIKFLDSKEQFEEYLWGDDE